MKTLTSTNLPTLSAGDCVLFLGEVAQVQGVSPDRKAILIVLPDGTEMEKEVADLQAMEEAGI